MGKAETGAMAQEAPLLILRVRVDTTSKLLSWLLRAMPTIRGWGDSDTMHELSRITASENTREHAALLYTGHTAENGTTYPAAVWYALDDCRPPAACVMLTISARLRSQTVLDHVYDVLKMLRASYPDVSVELAETRELFVDRDEALLPYNFNSGLITPVISLGTQAIEPVSIAPTHEAPAADAARPAPWAVPLQNQRIEPTPQILANWERRQQEGINVVSQAPTPASRPPSIEKAKSAKYGTGRDLTYDDVKEIVTQCNAWTARGGKVSAFYKFKGKETGDGSFALETLRKWLTDPRFE